MARRHWLSYSDDELARRDIAEINLSVGVGLPTAVPCDVGACRKTLDEWVEVVRSATENSFRRFRHRPEYRDDSDAQFRMLSMITVLQRNLGVFYNLAFMDDPYDARDSSNMFLHGLLIGRGGSCVTMPILYTAIGRRLGYPLRLVLAKTHTFCRWDDPKGERFNIEGASLGYSSYPDSFLPYLAALHHAGRAMRSGLVSAIPDAPSGVGALCRAARRLPSGESPVWRSRRSVVYGGGA